MRVLCVRLSCIRTRGPHPERVSRIPRTPSGVRMFIALFSPGGRKRRLPWLGSWHRSAVRVCYMLRRACVSWKGVSGDDPSVETWLRLQLFWRLLRRS